jgi:hypothetical protein
MAGVAAPAADNPSGLLAFNGGLQFGLHDISTDGVAAISFDKS